MNLWIRAQFLGQILVWERWIDGSSDHSLILGTEGVMDQWIDGSLDSSLILGTVGAMDRWIIGFDSLPSSSDRYRSGSDGSTDYSIIALFLGQVFVWERWSIGPLLIFWDRWRDGSMDNLIIA